MRSLLAAIGAGLLAYVVYLISGIGVAIIAFIGIALIIGTIYWWLHDTRSNALRIYEIQNNQHYELLRVIYKIENTLRK